jgi:hypothetical protein
MNKLISVDRVKKIIKETCFVDAGRFGVIVNATELIEAIDKEPASECQRCKELEGLLREANKHIEHHAIDSSLWRKIKQALGDV